MSTNIKKPNVKQAVPFFMVKNMETSLSYYESIDFKMTNSWVVEGKIRWCLLEIGKAALMLQEYNANALNQKPCEGISVYFICEDALAIYSHLIASGVPATEPFVGNSMWVVGLSDPDGYKIFFESATDVPEETRYSDWIKN